MSEHKIILDLSQSTDVVELDNEQLFQVEAQKRLFELVIAQLVKADLYAVQYETSAQKSSNLFFDRSHNAITVCGSRGSGKTTFLRHVLTRLDNPSQISQSMKIDDHEGDIKKSLEGLAVLACIDPTLISSKEHVLVILISLIKQKVDESRNSTKDKLFSKWQETLRELSGGLCQMDGIGSSNLYGAEWEDRKYIFEKGLEKASSGFQLERKLNDFIFQSLEVLDKKAFVITFDDIDTQFERGWPVLETVRKYLTSSQLIVLISGDIELYSTLIRSAQMKSLGSELLLNDRPSSSFHNSSDLRLFEEDPILRKIRNLEEQYLLKVLKPENRIYMNNLHQLRALYDNKELKIEVVHNDFNENIYGYLSRVMKEGFGVTESNELNSYIVTILSSPARTLWQFIKASEIIGTEVGAYRSASSINKFSIRISDIYSTSLVNSGFALAEFNVAQSSLNKLISLLWSWGVREGFWKKFTAITPNSTNENKNNIILCFNSVINSHVKNGLQNVIEIMVKISFLTSVASRFLLNNESKEIKQILEEVDINDTISSLRLSLAKIIAVEKLIEGDEFNHCYFWVPNDSSGFRLDNAMPKLYGKRDDTPAKYIEKVLSKKQLDIESNPFLGVWWEQINNNLALDNKIRVKADGKGVIFNTIETINENFGVAGKLVNLAVIRYENHKSEKNNFMSFITLLASISDILRNDYNDFHSFKLEVIKKSIVIDVKAIDWSNDTSSYTEIEEDGELYEEIQSEYNESFDDFLLALYNWYKSTKLIWSEVSLSIKNILKIMDRYFKQAGSDKRDIYLGNLIHYQIVAFLHSVLYEESMSKNCDVIISPKAIDTSEREFVQNLNKIYKKGSEIDINDKSLLSCLISCPLIAIFLKDKLTYKKASADFSFLHIHEIAYKNLTGDSLYSIASSMKVEGNVYDRKLTFVNLYPILNTVPMLFNQSEKGNLLDSSELNLNV